MKPELLNVTYKLNQNLLDILKETRDLIDESPETAVEYLDCSIMELSEANGKLELMKEVNRIVKEG